MKQMNFTIFILVGGYACSVIVFVAELIIHRHVKKDRERKKRE